MNKHVIMAVIALLSGAQPALAVQVVGTPAGNVVGELLSATLGVDLAVAAGGALPADMGGVAAIAALSLAIGIQLIKRGKK